MPKLTSAVYNPNDAKWWRDTAEAGDKERQARLTEIDAGWTYYYGEMPEPLKVRVGEPNYNVLLELSGQAVDAMGAFMGVPLVEVEGGTAREPDEAGALQTIKTAEQEALDAFWDANDLEVWIVAALLSGATSGHNFVKLVDDTDDDGNAMLRAELLDPRYVTVFWSNYRQPLFYRLKWAVDSTETRTQDIVPEWLIQRDPTPEGEPEPEISNTWRIFEWREKGSQVKEPVGDDAWAFPFAPIVDWQNALKPFDYYGRPDLTKIRRRNNDAANLVASNMQKILINHAGPQTVVTGGKLKDRQEFGPDIVIDDLDADAKVYNLEMAGDLDSSQNFLMLLRGAYFESMKVVDRASIKDKLGDLTNFAVRMLYGAQSDAATQKQKLYGRGLAAVSRRALALTGADVGKVIVKWPDLLPQDRGEIVRAVQAEDDMGFVSEQTMLEELGHDPVVEAEQRGDEQGTRQDSLAETLVKLGERGGFGANGGRRG